MNKSTEGRSSSEDRRCQAQIRLKVSRVSETSRQAFFDGFQHPCGDMVPSSEAEDKLYSSSSSVVMSH